MNAEMMPIRSLGLRSAAYLFALWYSLWGAVGGMVFLSLAAEHLRVPLALFIPFVDLHLNIDVTRAPTLPGAIVQAMFFVLFCAATGWVSGLLTALVYNLVSKHLGYQLRGSAEIHSHPEG